MSESTIPTPVVTLFLILLAATFRDLEQSRPPIPLRRLFLETMDRHLEVFGPGAPDHDGEDWRYLQLLRTTLEKIGDDEVLKFLVDPPEGPSH